MALRNKKDGSNSYRYFEPNAKPEEIAQKETQNQKIRLRFRCQEDVEEFERLMGVKLRTKNGRGKLTLPLGNQLSSFFG